jgi:hypothetical protein
MSATLNRSVTRRLRFETALAGCSSFVAFVSFCSSSELLALSGFARRDKKIIRLEAARPGNSLAVGQAAGIVVARVGAKRVR